MKNSMVQREALPDFVRAMTLRDYDEYGLAADSAVLMSLVAKAAEPVLLTTLRDFFDFEPLVIAAYVRFEMDGSNWTQTLRETLTEALVFAGFDDKAQALINSDSRPQN